MSSPNDTNNLPPPDLSPHSTPGWQVALVGGIGAVLTVGVLTAIQQDYRTAVEVGTVLAMLGLVLGIGMITTSSLIRLVCALSLISGGVLVFALGFMDGNALWMAGGVVIFLAGELVVLRERLLPRDRAR